MSAFLVRRKTETKGAKVYKGGGGGTREEDNDMRGKGSRKI